MFLKVGKTCVFFVLSLVLLCATAQAQEEWEYATILYLWGAGLDGEVAAKGFEVQIDQDFGDILDNLEFGFSGGIRAFNGQWSFTGDLMYIGLGATPRGPLGNPIEVDVDQWMIAGDVGYEVAQGVEVLGGARIVSLQNKIQFPGPLVGEVEGEKTWVDPVIGIRLAPRLGDNWVFWTRFDFGGFDIGSDFTWQLNTNIVWEFSEKAALAAGYRVLDIKYDDEEGDQEFKYDATSHGPIVGLVFTF